MKRRLCGRIVVDSSSFWIGDPIYSLGPGITVSEVCDTQICEVDIQDIGGFAQGVYGYTGGDGYFPVYAEYDDDEVLQRVILDFTEEEYDH